MADYPISNVARRIVYTGSAGVGPYAFPFEVLTNTDINVYKNDTLLTLTTNYTVTISPTLGTGSITLVVAATGTDRITIIGARAVQRTTDFTTGGDFFAGTLNDEMDSQTILTQQVAETAERSIRAPVTDPTSINMTLPKNTDRAGKYLSFNASTGNPETTSSVADVTTVAANATNINTVATNIASVNSAATNIAAIIAAPTQATNAANSATAASGYATAAQSAQTAAEAARDQTLSAFDNFDDRYLGTKTSNPTLDNDGNALLAGALYFNSVTGVMNVYTGSAWVAAYVSGTGFAAIASSNTFTENQIISVTDNTNAALRITQLGTGNALIVEDSTNPDSTPFVVDASGNVGIGTTTPANKFEVFGDGSTGERIAARANSTANLAQIEAQAFDYWSSPTYTGTSLRQFGSTATGTTSGLSNANLGQIVFQNASAGLISTNGGNPIVFATTATERMRIDASGVITSGLGGMQVISGTAVTSTSGTSITFTGIPAWAKKITVMFSGVSTSGTSNWLIQLGSGSVETTGYLGSCSFCGSTTSASNFTAGIGLTIAASSNVVHGGISISLIGSNVWSAFGIVGRSDAAGTFQTGSSKTTSGTLDRVRITTVNGTDTFDAGSINILYE